MLWFNASVSISLCLKFSDGVYVLRIRTYFTSSIAYFVKFLFFAEFIQRKYGKFFFLADNKFTMEFFLVFFFYCESKACETVSKSSFDFTGCCCETHIWFDCQRDERNHNLFFPSKYEIVTQLFVVQKFLENFFFISTYLCSIEDDSLAKSLYFKYFE